MLKKEREIKDQNIINEILTKNIVCRIAINDIPSPYIVPLNFGYRDNALWFHCAKRGKKLELIEKNPNVSFEIEHDMSIEKGELACQWTTKYRSVIGHGKIEIFRDNTEMKIRALDAIMCQHGKTDSTYSEKMLNAVCVLKLSINSFTAKGNY